MDKKRELKKTKQLLGVRKLKELYIKMCKMHKTIPPSLNVFP